MALLQRGKNNYYHCYFRTVIAKEDGTFKYATRTVNLYTTSLVEAKAIEAELLKKNKAARQHQRSEAHRIRLEVEAGFRPVSDLPGPIKREKRQKRLALAAALEAAGKYRKLGETTVRRFKQFIQAMSGVRYMDEITPEMAFDWLNNQCPLETSGKNYNNLKSAVNAVFKLTLLESGLQESPFARIPNRTLESKHQRPFTEDEFVRIYHAAEEPWKTAVLIAWHTGLRQKDVFLLRWDQIDGDILVTTPAKTARFGRSVRIPLHPQLAAALDQIPRTGDRVLGAWDYDPQSIQFRRYFHDLLDLLGIRDNEQGIVAFNSLRDSFVTRCDEAGIPRHAIRGLVGHVSDDQTDLYSHDLASARLIQNLPGVKLD